MGIASSRISREKCFFSSFEICRSMGIYVSVILVSSQILAEFLAGESTVGHVNEWAAFADVLEDSRSGDDASTMQEIVDTVQGQPQEDLWKEQIIDNDLMFGGDYSTDEALNFPDSIGFGNDIQGSDFGMSLVGPIGGVGSDDYLEINDLTSGFEGFDSRGPEIQLRPPRNNVMAMQFDSQGDTARRMLLMRPQASISHAAMPAVSHQSRILHTSASSRDLSEFADLASSSLDLQGSSGGWSHDREPQDFGREGAGVVPDSGIESARLPIRMSF